VKGIERARARQVLLGVTGSGRHSTMAQVIARYAAAGADPRANKTLAAQLYGDSKASFQHAVEYFRSYYDYYQPEAYVPLRTPISKKNPR